MSAAVVVIGVGNELRGDDAAGLLTVRAVDGTALPSAVQIVESDGEAARLLGQWSGADTAIVVDAVRTGAPPGTVLRVDVESDTALPSRWSGAGGTHALGIADAVALGRAVGAMPDRLVVIGIEVASTETGSPPGPAVRQAVGAAARMVEEEVAACVSPRPAG